MQNDTIGAKAAPRPANKRPHNLILENRKRLSVTGVCDVGSFDEHIIVIETDQGELTVKGENLHIDRLSVESGDLTLSGKVFALVYTDERDKSSGLFGRIFR